MSYILDALKKAESERKLGSVPNVYMEPMPTETFDESKSALRRPWVRVLAAALLAGGIGAAWMILPQQEKGDAVPEKVAQQSDEPVPVAAVEQPAPLIAANQQGAAESKVPAPAPTPAPAPKKIEASPAPKTENAASRQKPVLAAKPVADPAKPTPGMRAAQKEDAQTIEAAPSKRPSPAARTVSNPASSPASSPASAPATAPPPADVQIAALRDLPDHFQRNLPPLSVGGYIYSANPADRSMLLNNRLVREGEQVASGLTLEKMMPREAILNYQGQRFRLSY